MTLPGPRIAIVGAGIIGASLAYHMVRRGATVRLFDAGPGPAGGVTGQAFGWVNLIHGDPAHGSAYRLRQDAVAEYGRLRTELPEAFSEARQGSLVWKDTAEATEALIRAHRAAGAPIELLGRDAVRNAVPHLRDAPRAAAYSPDDLAISPPRVASALLHAAIAAGLTVHWGEQIRGFETSDSRITGLRTESRPVSADIVIVAAGADTGRLLSGLGLDPGLGISPALLLRYTTERHFIGPIVGSPGLEIRQASGTSLLVAEDIVEGQAAESPEAVGLRKLDAVRRTFDVPGTVTFDRAAAGGRPMFDDGMPRLGFPAGVAGLYLAVGHPGVILAPLLGRLAADEIIGGACPLLPRPVCRPA